MIIPYFYSLGSNRIGNKGASDVAHAVKVNNSLQHLE